MRQVGLWGDPEMGGSAFSAWRARCRKRWNWKWDRVSATGLASAWTDEALKGKEWRTANNAKKCIGTIKGRVSRGAKRQNSLHHFIVVPELDPPRGPLRTPLVRSHNSGKEFLVRNKQCLLWCWPQTSKPLVKDGTIAQSTYGIKWNLEIRKSGILTSRRN